MPLLGYLFILTAYKFEITATTGVLPYPRVIRSKAYRGYVEPRIITNAIYNVIFV
jgi:hypothetical protein